MSLLDALRHRIQVLRSGERYAGEQAREQAFHRELEAQALQRTEASPRDAELAARRAFGNGTYYREEARRMTTLSFLDHLRQDVSYTLRGLRRSPGFTATVVLTLALGFGANAAMFAVLQDLFVRTPSGVVNAKGVRRLYSTWSRPDEPGGRAAFDGFIYPQYKAMLAADSGVALAAYQTPDSVALGIDGARVNARKSEVTRTYFGVLGLHPQLGRFFTADEDHIDTPTPVVVLGDALWRRAFNADRGVLGRTIQIDNHPFTVVGVAPPDFSGVDLDAADLWVPLNTRPAQPQMLMVHGKVQSVPWYESYMAGVQLLARPRSPADEAQLVSRGTAVMRSVHIPGFVFDSTSTVLTGPITEALGPAKPTSGVSIATKLSAAALIVLLIAAANVTNLLLLRATKRKHEIGVRRALGVSRGRLFAQVTTEGIVLALIGGVLATLVAFWAATALRRLMMPHTHFSHWPLDGTTLLFLVGVSILVGAAAALAPAFGSLRPDLVDALKAGGRGNAYQRSRLRDALIVLQAAWCIVLVVGAALFVRSLQKVEGIGSGYDIDNISFMMPHFPEGQKPDETRRMALPAVAARMAHVGGVRAVAYAAGAPLWSQAFGQWSVPGRDSIPGVTPQTWPTYTAVSAGFFEAVGVRLLAGRDFSSHDLAGAPGAVIVNATMARMLWPNQSPIGQCLIIGKRTDPCSTVVGLVADAHARSLIEKPALNYYLPLAQQPRGTPTVLILRTDPARRAEVVHEAQGMLRQMLPGADAIVPLEMARLLDGELRPWRLGATLFLALGALALCVAAIGVYSVVAYGVSQRTHEMGVRIALGARATDILNLVLGEGIRTVLIGIVLGVAASLALGRLVASLLYGVSPKDPGSLAVAAVLLCVVGAFACLIPGWRAARTDPMNALRAE